MEIGVKQIVDKPKMPHNRHHALPRSFLRWFHHNQIHHHPCAERESKSVFYFQTYPFFLFSSKLLIYVLLLFVSSNRCIFRSSTATMATMQIQNVKNTIPLCRCNIDSKRQ